MQVTNYLRILRQRWLLVMLPCIAALLVAGFTLPDEEEASEPVVNTYQATATLITSATPSSDQEPLSLATVALFATTGDIPERAAELLDYQGEPQVLASLVTVTPSPETGTLAISSVDADGKVAAERVNMFAQATIDYFQAEAQQQAEIRVKELQQQITRTSAEVGRLEKAGGSDPGRESTIAGLNQTITALVAEKAAVQGASTKAAQLTVLQSGVPIPQSTQTFAAPSNPLFRIGIAGLLGLLLGAALALVVERVDSRMRTREQVEEATGLPVLAEIPLLPNRHRSGVVSASRPASSAAEAFRTLRSAVLLSPGVVGTPVKGGRGREAVVLLMTSALPGAGKTTTVANLAAVMAEAGRRVLVLSLDLRNPTLHKYFGVPNGTGISELLSADRGRHLEEVVRETDVPGVAIATSGHDTDHPGALLASVRPLITAARSLADVVIIDAPPLLVVSDALDVARHADVTLLVSKLNKTTRGQAEECQRLFTRLGVSALGTILVGSRPAGARYGYPTVRPEPDEQPTARSAVGEAAGPRPGTTTTT